MNTAKRPVSVPWWIWLIVVDVFLVIMTALYPHIPDIYGKSRLMGPFNLAVEMNIAVWWSGIGFVVLSVVAYEHFCTGNNMPERMAWLSLSILLAALFCDEIGSLHERAGGFSRLLPYGVAAASLLTFALIMLYRKAETRRTSFLVLSGFVLFGAVAGMEKLEHSLTWPDWSLGIRVGVEEGAELVGTFLLFWGVVMQRQSGGRTSWQNAIPNLHKMRHLNRIILCGMIIHVIASMILPYVMEFPRHRGNPLVLYPAALYIVLSLGSLRQYLNSGADSRRTFAWVSVFFVICSLGSMYNLFTFLPKVSLIVPETFNAMYYSLHLLQLAVLGFLIMRGSPLFYKKKMTLPYLLFAVLIIGFMVRGMSLQAAVDGVIAWLFAQVFLPQFTDRHPAFRETELAETGA